MTPNKRIIVNTGILYLKMLLTIVFTLLSTRWVLEALGVDDYGIYNVVAGIIAMFSFLNTAMAVGTQRNLSFQLGRGDQTTLKQVFKCSIIIHVVIGFIIFVLIEVLGVFFIKDILNFPFKRMEVVYIVLHTLAASTFFTIAQVPYLALINAHENLYYIAIVNVFESVWKFMIAYYLLSYSGDRLILYSLLMLGITILSTIAMAVYCHIQYSETSNVYKEKAMTGMVKFLLSYSLWNVLGAFGILIKGQGITMLYNSFFGVAVNAALGIARQLDGQLNFFSNSIIRAFNPQIIKSEGEGNHTRMLRLSCTSCKISTLLMLIIVVPIMFNLPFVLNVWLKDVPEHTVILSFLTLIGAVVYQMYHGIELALHAVGKIKGFSAVTMTVNIVVIPLSYVALLMGCSLETVMIISLLGTFVNMFVVAFYVQRNCELSIQKFCRVVFVPMSICFAISCILCATVSCIANSWGSLILCFLFNAIIIVCVFYCIALSQSEHELIAKMAGRVRNLLCNH